MIKTQVLISSIQYFSLWKKYK